MEQDLLAQVRQAVDALPTQANVSAPSIQALRAEAERFGRKTRFGSYNFTSTVKSRSAALTVYLGVPEQSTLRLTQKRKEIIEDAPKTIAAVNDYLKKAPLIRVCARMGYNDFFSPDCTLYVSTYRREMVRLAYMVAQTLFPPRDNRTGPRLDIVCLPEWQEKDRQILVMPEIGVTYILGTDYYGESKKGFQRMAVWHARKHGMIGLQAGTKIIRARHADDSLRRLGMIIFGLSATGKTTHTCHTHNLDLPGEGVEIIQDDAVFWRRDASALGTERGFYIKAEGLDPNVQPILYEAATQPETVLENVMVDYRGNVFFNDDTLTSNARGIVQHADLGEYASPGIDLPPVEELDGLILAFLVRRNTVIPIASKLTPEQAAAAFMLGESFEGPSSDTRRPGESVREAGAGSLIFENGAEEGNLFYEFLKRHENRVECYMLNTGGVGELVQRDIDGTRRVRQKVTRVQVHEMAAIIRGIARGSIGWEPDAYWDLLVPKYVEGMDVGRFKLDEYYTRHQIDYYIGELRMERREYIERFAGLDSAIVRAAEM